LLDQVKKEVMSEFKEQITHFEWFHEDEYTLITAEIGEIALQIPLGNRMRQIANDIIGHPDASQYIVPISVRAIESVDATDGLFNLTYHGAGSNSFFVHYYALEREQSRPFKVLIPYRQMFDAVGTIHLDSPARLWEQLIRPIDETYAKHYGIHSFSKELLAKELRDFLVKHLDFIKHIAEVTGKLLQILEPAPRASVAQSTNGTEPKPPPLNPLSRQRWGEKGEAARKMALRKSRQAVIIVMRVPSLSGTEGCRGILMNKDLTFGCGRRGWSIH